jgi:hypothetical protein
MRSRRAGLRGSLACAGVVGAVVLAIHQMRGDVKVPVGDFFDTHLG